MNGLLHNIGYGLPVAKATAVVKIGAHNDRLEHEATHSCSHLIKFRLLTAMSRSLVVPRATVAYHVVYPNRTRRHEHCVTYRGRS